MVQFNFTFDPSISVEQRVGFELAAIIWGSYLTDDIEVNLHIASSDSLGENGQAVGGAIPLFHEQDYGVYQQYAEADATSDTDEEALDSQQEGNTVDFLVDGQVVDGNTDILLTSAQAKALGMDEALELENGGTWDRNLVDENALDGYILVSNHFDWNYDYTRSGEAPEGTLDFMSMALHEIGHQLGFVSSLDGTLDMNTLYSGATQAEGFSVLDLFRHSIDSSQVDNPDGAVTELSLGQNSYFSIDGGETNLANFANGVDYQASHWERMQSALGIMDPTLAYQERASLNALDLQAMDVLGWDVNYDALNSELDLDTLLTLAENKVEGILGLSATALDSSRGGGENGDLYQLGYGEWWAIFEKHVLELGYGEWWSIFEMGYDEWKQQFENGNSSGNNGEALLELGYGEWWQAFEANVLELGYGEWWQTFEGDMLALGYGEWWQLLELGYGEWWQTLEKFSSKINKGDDDKSTKKLQKFFSTLDKIAGNIFESNSKWASGGVAGRNAKIFRGGEHDDIIAGDKKQDRIKAGAGDDLIDGKEGHDVIWGEAGNDTLYGQDGNDLLDGGDGDDLLLGEADDDKLHGNDGNDIVSGGSGDDIVTGGKGNDDLTGGSGKDVLHGGKDDDRLEGESGSDILIGGNGQDQLHGGDDDDVLYGDAYAGTKSLQQLRTQLQTSGQEDSEESETAPENTSYNPIRIEAESMTLSGDAYVQNVWDIGAVENITITGTNSSSTATTTFSGESGSYMLVARYLDSFGGSGQLNFSLNETALNSFDLDQDTNRYYTQTVVQNLTLNTGDELTITAIGGDRDKATLDYVEFIPLNNLLTSSTEMAFVSNPPEQTTTTTESSGSLLSGLLGGSSLLGGPSLLGGLLGTPTPEEPEVPTQITTADSSALRVEAEAMFLVGDYFTEANQYSSGGGLIAVDARGEGKALTKFDGNDGYYNIVVGYYDESGSAYGQISTLLNGQNLDSWRLDNALSTYWDANDQTFTTRTVASTVFLKNGDIFELSGLGGDGYGNEELARIDYVDFVTVDLGNSNETETNESPQIEASQVEPSPPVITGEAIRVEAEYMTLSGYSVEGHSSTSNRQLIKTNSSGTATTAFSGDSGYYNIVIAYYDENDGLATLSASLDGVELDEWQLDQNLWSNYVSSNNKVTRTVATQIQVNTGDELTLQGIREYGEYARIDYVEFIPVSAPVALVSETANDDFLQGGAGDDTLYGGKGNDTLYGESQSDNASNILQGSQTFNGHTYVLSELGSWQEAQIQAQQLGGNLVTINSAVEENWIRNTFSNTERLWTGFSDAVTEGEWQWVSGEAVTYTNWVSGTPYEETGYHDFATMNYGGGEHWEATWLETGWEWNGSEWILGDGLRGIIEINATDNDVLVGGSGHDTLYGNGGDDNLYGDILENTPSPNSPLNNGLVGHWAFDETSGLQAGDATGGNTGTLTNMGGQTWKAGTVGGALDFSGSNDYVLVADAAELDITQTLTLATWVNADTFKNWTGLVVKGTSKIAYALELNSSGNLIFEANYGGLSGANGQGTFYSNSGLTLNQWHHVAVTYDGSNVQFYIDGQLDSSQQASITLGNSNENLVIGADLLTGGGNFDGDLDDVRVYNRALSAEELAQLSAGESGVTVSGEGGNDFLYGGVGNDTLEGGAGNDVLDGSDAIAAGYFEQDVLVGGLGADTFVLGNVNQAYYQGNDALDFATIQDFKATEDVIQLHGSAGNYSLQQQGNDTYLYHQNDTSDLVAVLKNVSSSNFNTGFQFV